MSENEPGHEPAPAQPRPPEQQDLPATIATIDAVGHAIRAEIRNYGGPNHNSAKVPTGKISQVMFYNTGNGARVNFMEEHKPSSHPTKIETMSTEFAYDDTDPDHPRLGEIGFGYNERDEFVETFRNLTQIEAEALLERMKDIKPYERQN